MLKVTLATLLLITLLLELVFLFMNLQHYSSFKFSQTAYLLLLKFPSLLAMIVGPGVLFATTYFISTLYSNNEFISLLSAGVSYFRIVRPVLILSIIFTTGFFVFNEYVRNPSDIKYDNAYSEFSEYSVDEFKNDNRNISLQDTDHNLTIRCGRYIDRSKRLENINISVFDDNNDFKEKIYSPEATWDEENGIWVLNDS